MAVKTLRLTVTEPITKVLDILKKEYPTLTETEILKLALAETAKSVESKSLLNQASTVFDFGSKENGSDNIFDPKNVSKYEG